METVKIVDYTQLPYKYIFTPNIAQLSTIVDGRLVNTTIPNYTIKEIVRLSDYGDSRTAVVFDSSKKDLQRSAKSTEILGLRYKDGRKNMPPQFYEGINLTMELLLEGGVPVYRAKGYEADDIIYNIAKEEESKGNKVDIFTNDSDLFCLVSDLVTVYYRGAKAYGAESGNVYRGYTIITPKNYGEALGSTSQYRGCYIPYNSMYMYKLICGDKSDNIPKYKGYGPARYNDLMAIMDVDGFDFSKATPENFEYVYNFLESNYEFDGTDSGLLEHMLKVHKVMQFPKLSCDVPSKYTIGNLCKACSKYNITIPVVDKN